ncbi:MAG: hypothetical protein KKB31_07700 [Nanoarchaeota archaeon]|nr:hypothetical protein [Nanoarchaeota archaeon]
MLAIKNCHWKCENKNIDVCINCFYWDECEWRHDVQRQSKSFRIVWGSLIVWCIIILVIIATAIF